ncbi:hypothetical protein EDB84DRAFT_1506109 [Lactarius hengduanensis]|nr:hypothetical protein EDB84DRAFT_1506109 [Lactarius hengduanensis]
MHGAFCMAGFLLSIPPGLLMVQYAKVTGSPRAFELHRLLQLRLAGRFIAGGTLAYLFMDDNASGGTAANKVIPMMIYPKAEPHPHAQTLLFVYFPTIASSRLASSYYLFISHSGLAGHTVESEIVVNYPFPTFLPCMDT